MSEPQALASRSHNPDLSVAPSEYFGKPVDEIQNANSFGLVPEGGKDLYRVQYLFLLAYGNSKSSTDYGGIQLRASTYLYLHEGRVPIKMQRVMQRIGHRGAYLFNSPIQNAKYGGGGGGWGDKNFDHERDIDEHGGTYSGSGGGYLDGFTPVESGAEYRNWEVEPVGTAEGRPAGVQPGVIQWTTEIYLEDEGLPNWGDPYTGANKANLSGVAQGISDPYNLVGHEQEEVEAQQSVWNISDNFNQARGSYQIAPPGYTASRERSQELHGKNVYLNGLNIGELDVEGRVWLKKEYQGGDTYRGQHSRESVISKTAATPQALRLGGNVYKIDESPSSIHLVTAAAKPDDFDPVGPDEVDPGLKVVPGGTVWILSLPDEPGDATRQVCRQDQEIIRHLGFSDPPYEHSYNAMWKWPSFRPIAEYGTIRRPGGLDDEDQDTLDEYGGDDE